MKRAMNLPRLLLAVIFPMLCFSGLAHAEAQQGLQTRAKTTPITQTRELATQAKKWGLKTTEYHQYLELINGPLGKWNADIDPLLALGMFATTAQDEQRFAELYAQQEFDLTERALRFQTTYRNAFQRLYPNAGMLDQRLLAPYFEHQQQKANFRQKRQLSQRQFIEGDRLLVFVPLDCDTCQMIISRLMGLVSAVDNSGVDIYVRDAPDDVAVRRWAQGHHIQNSWLNQQRLTLNRDEGLYLKMQSRARARSSEKVPVFLKRNDQFYQLNTQELGL